MLAQYSALGCVSPVPSCLCENVNFGYGLWDCANGEYGTAASSVICWCIGLYNQMHIYLSVICGGLVGQRMLYVEWNELLVSR